MNSANSKVTSISSETLSRNLVEAAANGETQQCLLLLAQGADINAPDKKSNRPLLVATSHREIGTAMALLENGADINVRCKDGFGVLHLAPSWPVDDYVKLIAMGANVNALTKNRISPLHWASGIGHAKALLQARAHPDIRADLGATPLSNAISLNNCPLIELLVNAGADPNAKSVHRSSYLMEAQSKNNLEIASLLIALGAESKKYKGRNAMWQRLFSLPPLHAAASGGHTGAALALVKKGADPTDLFLRKTAAQFAMNSGHSETAAVLHAAEARLAMDQMFSSSNAINFMTPKI